MLGKNGPATLRGGRSRGAPQAETSGGNLHEMPFRADALEKHHWIDGGASASDIAGPNEVADKMASNAL